MAKDPVCGKEIDEARARIQTGQTLHGASEVDPQQGTRMFHNGSWYYFCGLECRSKFMASPQTYLKQAGT
jgi:YHS domain-containing protein